MSNLYVQFDTILRAIGKMYGTHRQTKDVVTYVSPVEVFVNEIKIFNQKIVLDFLIILNVFTRAQTAVQ